MNTRTFSLVMSAVMLAAALETAVQIAGAAIRGTAGAIIPLVILEVTCILTFCYSIYKFINSKEDE